MIPAAVHPVAKLLNRVLADHPLARVALARHAGQRVEARVGPATLGFAVEADGYLAMVGEGRAGAPDAAFTIPLSLLPRLAARDEAAFREVAFTGDSEFAATLADVARHARWDLEEDLSRAVGDIAAHRLAGAARDALAWQADARTRLTENAAEYLVHEMNAFVHRDQLERLARDNETLRDDLARLTARIDLLSSRERP